MSVVLNVWDLSCSSAVFFGAAAGRILVLLTGRLSGNLSLRSGGATGKVAGMVSTARRTVMVLTRLN